MEEIFRRQYYFLNKVTQQKLLEYITKDNVEEKNEEEKESRDVSITSILKMQENTYQVRWTENNYTDTGTCIFYSSNGWNVHS